MGTIRKREGANNLYVYQVIIRIRGSKPITRTFDTKEEAEDFEAKTEAEIRSHLTRRKNISGVDFLKKRIDVAIGEYLKQDGVTKRQRCHLANAKKFLGRVCFGELTPSFIKGYVKTVLSKKTYRGTYYTPATVAVYFGVLNGVYRWQREELDLPAHPGPFATRYLPSNWNEGRERRLERSEELALRLLLRQRKNGRSWNRLLTLALETGCRQQELLYATWSEFDLKANSWIIPKSHTKSKKTRAIPLSAKAVRVVQAMRPKNPAPNQRVFDCFTNKDYVSIMFHRYTLLAGIKDYRFHDLRHEAISRMVLYRRGVSVYEIMRIVGHSSIEMLNRYANLRPDELVKRFNS